MPATMTVMSTPPRSPITALLQRYLPGLKYPWLFAILAALLGLDLLIPDAIPLLDELGLAVLTLLVGSWRTRRPDVKQPPPDPPIDP